MSLPLGSLAAVTAVGAVSLTLARRPPGLTLQSWLRRRGRVRLGWLISTLIPLLVFLPFLGAPTARAAGLSCLAFELLLALNILLLWRPRLVGLDPNGLVVQGWFRIRTVPWDHIDRLRGDPNHPGIRVSLRSGGRQQFMTVSDDVAPGVCAAIESSAAHAPLGEWRGSG